MRNIKPLPSHTRLKELLDYDQNSGSLLWKSKVDDGPVNRRWNTLIAGKTAGSLPKKSEYWWISIDDENHLLHRVIFKWMTGRDPQLVDHADGNKLNNRWNNLREASENQNRCNSLNRPGKSGVKGLSQTRQGKWKGTVYLNRKRYTTPSFVQKQDAINALDILRSNIHGIFAKKN